MRPNFASRFQVALLIAVAFGPIGSVFAQEDAAGANLAIVAQPSSSYVSGDTSLTAMNDEYDPRSSRDRSRGSYGNWNRVGTQWVQYDWSRPISTNRVDVYWWDDRRGVRLPRACRLLYWDGSQFTPVANPSGLGVEGDRYNTTTFDEVRTSRFKLEIDSNEPYSTGVLEWKIYDSGQSPDFPPMVTAGVDRVVIMGGRTWLNGDVRTLGTRGNGSAAMTWSKVSGPGRVTFEDAHAQATTATFSALGDYVLTLTAGTAPLIASDTLTVKVVPPPPATHLEPVDTQNYKIHSPLWNHRAKALIVKSLLSRSSFKRIPKETFPGFR